jgi:hypothetical protein
MAKTTSRFDILKIQHRGACEQLARHRASGCVLRAAMQLYSWTNNQHSR